MNDYIDTLRARMSGLSRSRRTPPPNECVAPSGAPTPETIAITLVEAARLVSVHPRTLRRWPLPWIIVGRVVRVRRADLDRFLAEKAGAVPE